MSRIVLQGEPVSNGWAIGAVFAIGDSRVRISRKSVGSGQIDKQISLLNEGIGSLIADITEMETELTCVLTSDLVSVFEAHKAILEDEFFVDEIKERIVKDKLSARNAVDECFKKYMEQIKECNGQYFRERVYDLEDIRARLLKKLIKQDDEALLAVENGSIAAVKVLTPYAAVMLARSKASGVVAEEGATCLSHAAIILKGLGIPVLNGIKYRTIKEYSGCNCIMDASTGLLILNPCNDDIKGFFDVYSKRKPGEHKSITTQDNCEIRLWASIDNREELAVVSSGSFTGVGLVRTEVLFIDYEGMPEMEEQIRAYLEIIECVNGKRVVFRTADIGSDKKPVISDKLTATDGQQQRGLGYSLANKTELIIQLKAFLLSGAGKNVYIMFPMVKNSREVCEAREMVQQAARELEENGYRIPLSLHIGAVIETVDAVTNLDDIIETVDFISIGTNDMLQQFTGTDRRSSSLKKVDYFDIRFLKALRYCIDMANSRKLPLNICGEMPSEPAALVLLIGMGARDFTISPFTHVECEDIIRKSRLDHMEGITQKVMECTNAIVARGLVNGWMQKMKEYSFE